MEQVLFICTGNYYRSRFAEIYFNYLATENDIKLSAFSRGLGVLEYGHVNTGPISPYARAFLNQLQIPLPYPLPFPKQFVPEDLQYTQYPILMHEDEHRPMMEISYPELAPKMIYWTYPDIQFKQPEEVLPNIKNAVEYLFQQLS